MRKAKIFPLILIAAVWMLASCGGGETADTGNEPAFETINVVYNDIYYGNDSDNIGNPPVWTATAGNNVEVLADNQGALEHNWAVIEAGATIPDAIADRGDVEDIILFDLGNIDGGTTGSGTFTAPAAGTYTVICTVAGHYPTMQGQLQVNG